MRSNGRLHLGALPDLIFESILAPYRMRSPHTPSLRGREPRSEGKGRNRSSLFHVDTIIVHDKVSHEAIFCLTLASAYCHAFVHKSINSCSSHDAVVDHQVAGEGVRI